MRSTAAAEAKINIITLVREEEGLKYMVYTCRRVLRLIIGEIP